MKTNYVILIAIVGFLVTILLGGFKIEKREVVADIDSKHEIERIEFKQDGVVCYLWDERRMSDGDNQMECIVTNLNK